MTPETTDNNSLKRAGWLKRNFLSPAAAYKTKKDDIELEVKTALMDQYGTPEDLAEKYADCISGDTEEESAVGAVIDNIDHQMYVLGSVNNVTPERIDSITKLSNYYKTGLKEWTEKNINPITKFDHKNAYYKFDEINVLEELKEIWESMTKKGISFADYESNEDSTREINQLIYKRAIKTDIDNTIGSIDYLHSNPKKAARNVYLRDGAVVGGAIGGFIIYKLLTGGDPTDSGSPGAVATPTPTPTGTEATDTVTPSDILQNGTHAVDIYAKTPSGAEAYIGTDSSGLSIVDNPIGTGNDTTAIAKTDQIIYIPPNMNVSDVITSLEMVARS